ncbi:alpha/beta hydrolase [Mycoplasmatota bacterium]|nr:alpha/beta hydrolase [Mycoplasmatota bacterium]
MTTLEIILIIVLVIVVLFEIICEYLLSQVITRKLYNEKKLLDYEINSGLLNEDFYNKFEKEEIWFKTEDGLNQRGIYIKNDSNSNKTIIIVHGITVSITTSIKYMRMFYDRGFNVLMYDQRRHGMSEGKYSTFGFYEKQDLDLWVNWVVDKNGADSIIGLHGESMGAATVLQYAGINKHVDFIIADCGFSNMIELMKYQIKKATKLPSFPILNRVTLKAKVRAKFRFKDISPIDVIKDSDLPILFIHGDKDTFVPTFMSEDMYNAKKGKKKLYIAKGAAHALSLETDKVQYEKIVNEFLDDVLQ